MSLSPLKITAIRRTASNNEIIFPNASCAILNINGTYATLKTDQSGATPLSNPFDCDANGEKQVWLEAGNYTVSVAGGATWSVSVGNSNNDSISNRVININADYEIDPEDRGAYLRFYGGTALTFTAIDFVDDYIGSAWNVRNASSQNLTLAEDSVTINPPAGGTKIIPPGGTASLLFVGDSEYDLIGVTVAA